MKHNFSFSILFSILLVLLCNEKALSEDEIVIETTVTDSRIKKDISKKTLEKKQFLQLPGSQGDPVKAVQNLPGVNRTNGFSSQIVIQGSAPQDTRYMIEGQEVPNVFHFGGLTSVVIPEAIDQVDFLSAGYGAQNGRALGGSVNLIGGLAYEDSLLNEENNFKKYFFFIDNLKAGFLYQKKLDETQNIQVGGRYSYVGQFFKNFIKNDGLSLTAVPEFADFSALYSKKLSETENLKLQFVYSLDKLGFLIKEIENTDPAIRGNFYTETSFYRFIPRYKKEVSDVFSYDLALGIGENKNLVDFSSNYFRLRLNMLTTTGEFLYKQRPDFHHRFGFDNTYQSGRVDVRLPLLVSSGGNSLPISSAETKQDSIIGKWYYFGVYYNPEYTFYDDKMQFIPGFRYDRFQPTKENFIQLRWALSYKKDENHTYQLKIGQYVQPAQPQEISQSFGNPDLVSPKSDHVSFGFVKKLEENEWTVTGFYKRFYDLVANSTKTKMRDGKSVFEIYNNSGTGKSYGLETMYKFKTENYLGWISYTLSKSTRASDSKSEYDFQFDQTHNLNIVAQREFSNNKLLGGRIRYVTGNPYTPVDSATFDTDQDVFVPKNGGFYSKRLQDFFQLDLRFDKKWIVRNSESWSFYIDIQNILNTKNVEQIRYSYDYSQREDINGLPILPAIGFKGEF